MEQEEIPSYNLMNGHLVLNDIFHLLINTFRQIYFCWVPALGCQIKLLGLEEYDTSPDR